MISARQKCSLGVIIPHGRLHVTSAEAGHRVLKRRVPLPDQPHLSGPF